MLNKLKTISNFSAKCFYAMLVIAGLTVIFHSTGNAQSTTTISGIVTANQVPVSGVTLYISGSNRRFYSKSGGAYQITVPAGAGNYTITVLPRSRIVAQAVRKTVSVASTNITNFNIDLTKAAAGESIIHGRITSKGQPLEGVKVRVSGVGDALTDKNGIYSSSNLKTGRYYISAGVNGYTFSGSLKQIRLRSDRMAAVNFSGRAIAQGATYLTTISGLYDFTVNSNKTTCTLQRLNLNGVTSVTQLNDRVTIRLPLLGGVTGKIQGSKIAVNVQKTKNFCRIKGTVAGDFAQADKGTIQGDATITCLTQPACTLNFSGNLVRK